MPRQQEYRAGPPWKLIVVAVLAVVGLIVTKDWKHHRYGIGGTETVVETVYVYERMTPPKRGKAALEEFRDLYPDGWRKTEATQWVREQRKAGKLPKVEMTEEQQARIDEIVNELEGVDWSV